MYDESTLLYVQTHSNLNEIQTLTDKTLGFTALHTHLSDISRLRLGTKGHWPVSYQAAVATFRSLSESGQRHRQRCVLTSGVIGAMGQSTPLKYFLHAHNHPVIILICSHSNCELLKEESELDRAMLKGE